VVRDTKTLDERNKSTRGIVMSPEELGAQRAIVARANADFARIFGSE
jgi:hypothetical protein